MLDEIFGNIPFLQSSVVGRRRRRRSLSPLSFELHVLYVKLHTPAQLTFAHNERTTEAMAESGERASSERERTDEKQRARSAAAVRIVEAVTAVILASVVTTNSALYSRSLR